MLLYWVLFFSFSVLSYTLIALFGHMTSGESTSALDSARKVFGPKVFVVMLASQIIFAVGLYYGFLATTYALPIVFSVGIIVSFFYSVIILGVSVTVIKIVGIACILFGVYLIS